MVLNPPDDTVITRHPLALALVRSENTRIVKALAREPLGAAGLRLYRSVDVVAALLHEEHSGRDQRDDCSVTNRPVRRCKRRAARRPSVRDQFRSRDHADALARMRRAAERPPAA
jgi:hypothetical protein